MSAKQIIEKLAQLGRIDAKTLKKLRKQVDDPTKNVSAKSIVRYLVENKWITREDGDRLLQYGSLSAGPDPGQATLPMEMRTKEVDTNDLLGEQFQVTTPNVPERPAPVATPRAERLVPIRDEGWTIAEQAPGFTKRREMQFGDAPQFGRELGATQEWIPPAVTAEPMASTVPVFSGKKLQGNQWESKWLFLGFGLLTLLVAVTIGLWWFLHRTTAEEAFAIADKQFNDGDFASARDSYLNFIDKFSSDAKVPLAKAKAVNAQLRSAFNSDNWALTLKAAQDELTKLASEPDNQLVQIQDDLSVILPKTSLGLSQKAVEATTTEEKRGFLLQSETVFAFVNNPTYVSTSRLRQDYVVPVLADRQKNVDQVKYEIDREETYQSKLESIGQLIDSGDTNQASIEDHALVETYPILRTRQPLIDLVGRISEKESHLVVPITVDLTTTTEDLPSRARARAIITAQVGSAIPDLSDKIVVYLINGTVYGLSAGDGSVLWWRRVGYSTAIQPLWVGEPHRSDLIVSDATRQELIRLSSRDGRVIWRTEIKEPFFKPALTKGSVFVTTRGGDRSKVIRLDIDSGKVEMACQLPQAASVGPAANPDVSVLYQMGRHSSLYILSQEDLKCVEVYYVGHQPDSIDVEPFLISGNLCVLVNFAQHCQAYVYGFRQRGVEVFESQPSFKIIDGKVSSSAYRYGRSVIVSSDTGEMRMYELVVSSDGDQTMAVLEPQVAGKIPTYEGIANYFAADRGELYVANKGFSKYRIQRSKEDFELRKTGDAADVFIGPVYSFETAAIHLRRRFHSSMITAAAVNLESLDEIWRTDFASPTLGQPFVVGDHLLAVSEQGDLFELTGESFEAGTMRPMVRGSSVKESLHFDQRIRLRDGTIVLTGQDCDRVLAFRPDQLNDARLSPLQAPANRSGGEPAGFGNELLVPSLEGQVVRINPLTGAIVGAPFQPPTNPNQSVQWTRPAVFDEQSLFVVGTGEGVLYSVEADGNKSLVRKGQMEVGQRFASPLIRVGDRVVVAFRTDGADRMAAFQVLPDLAEAASTPLNSPYAGQLCEIDSQIYFTTADSRFHCLNPDLTTKWEVDVPGKFVGMPQDAGKAILLAFDNGQIVRLDKSTGQTVQTTDLEQPLASAPFEYNGNWYISDQQGIVYVIEPIQ